MYKNIFTLICLQNFPYIHFNIIAWILGFKTFFCIYQDDDIIIFEHKTTRQCQQIYNHAQEICTYFNGITKTFKDFEAQIFTVIIYQYCANNLEIYDIVQYIIRGYQLAIMFST